jgi:hypothetical protein
MPKFVWRGRQQETTHYPEVSIDGLRACAERTGNYAGQLGPEWCGPDGEWKDIWLGDDPPTGARVGILRKTDGEVQFTLNGDRDTLWGTRQQIAAAFGCTEHNVRHHISKIYEEKELDEEATCKQDLQVQSSRPVPPQLQGFVARATERKTVVAALKYLHDEMLAVGGIEGGRIFQRITLRVPRSFRTREACAAANIECWLDIWDELQKLKEAHEFAPAVNS